MTTVSQILDKLDQLAPLELQLPFDNAGFLFGRKEQPVHRALLALDVTPEVIREAADLDAELIISHHPLIFSPLKKITDEKLLSLAENRLSVISMHTNLDIAEGGVNDVLLDLLGAKHLDSLDEEQCGRIGMLPDSMPMQDFLVHSKEALGCRGIRYYSSGKPVHKLAVMGGSGGDALETAWQKGCDTYLTADIKYHQFLMAKELGMNLLDADHFYTENPVIPVLSQMLAQSFPDVVFQISKQHDAVISFF